MRIILGSTNPSKKRAIEMALKELGIDTYEIICLESASEVSSRPIGFEMIRGSDKRNNNSKQYAQTNNITYDYLCGIEGGFSIDENGLPFVVTCAIIEDSLGNKSTGKSMGIRLTREMFDYLRDGGSLNEIIEELNKESNNHQNNGITGYLTNGLYTRDKYDKDAVISALIPLIFRKQRDLLNEAIMKKARDRQRKL